MDNYRETVWLCARCKRQYQRRVTLRARRRWGVCAPCKAELRGDTAHEDAREPDGGNVRQLANYPRR